MSDWLIGIAEETGFWDFGGMCLLFGWVVGFFLFFLFLEDSRLYPFAYLCLHLSDVLMKHIVVQELLSPIPCSTSYPVYNPI